MRGEVEEVILNIERCDLISVPNRNRIFRVKGQALEEHSEEGVVISLAHNLSISLKQESLKLRKPWFLIPLILDLVSVCHTGRCFVLLPDFAGMRGAFGTTVSSSKLGWARAKRKMPNFPLLRLHAYIMWLPHIVQCLILRSREHALTVFSKLLSCKVYACIAQYRAIVEQGHILDGLLRNRFVLRATLPNFCD